MRDVSRKIRTLRIAVAEAVLSLQPETIGLIREGRVPKGDPQEVARVAAVQAAKNTPSIIPYCHPLPLDYAGVSYTFGDDWIKVRAEVKAIHKTGVEMEALTAAAVAALTLYDMLKMLDTTMEIREVRLVSKTGGKSGWDSEPPRGARAGVLVVSDSVAEGRRSDGSGRLIVERLETDGFAVPEYVIVPDDAEKVREALVRLADEAKLDLVLTTGGTGAGPRDVTPEAMESVIEREAPGIVEAARVYGGERSPLAMLSRGRAGLRGNTLIVNLPGSPGGVMESLDALFPALFHALRMLAGEGHNQ
ncbi:bifunctional molybdenum cofactor biosynthesis protein MoaC/MoaB [bacterium]|nr:bifunctional molybdenum cofactor biosynthesis protein MoaC/MoaB [bacterium]